MPASHSSIRTPCSARPNCWRTAIWNVIGRGMEPRALGAVRLMMKCSANSLQVTPPRQPPPERWRTWTRCAARACIASRWPRRTPSRCARRSSRPMRPTASSAALSRVWVFHNAAFAEVSATSIRELVQRSESPEAEAIVIICTNLASGWLVDELKAELRKPVLDSGRGHRLGGAAHGRYLSAAGWLGPPAGAERPATQRCWGWHDRAGRRVRLRRAKRRCHPYRARRRNRSSSGLRGLRGALQLASCLRAL